MRASSYLLSTVVLFAAAQAAEAQTPTCQSVEFNPAVTERFPRLREACLDVIERQGQVLAVFKADLLKVSGNKVRLRAKLPDGTRAPAQTVQISPQRRVLVNGKSVRVDQLALGQELTIYAKVSEPVATIAPADTSEPIELLPVESEPVRVASGDPEMPRTASVAPAIGLGGAVLIVLAGALGLIRRLLNKRFDLPA
jgi:hypothetical protein